MQTSILITLFLTSLATASTIPHESRATGNATTSALFGTCTPTMDFQLGRTGRKATEGTFLPTDPNVAKGQGDALNPNIITNAICNNLINNCGLTKDSAGETKCLAAKAVVAALTTKDATTAAAFNSALGL